MNGPPCLIEPRVLKVYGKDYSNRGRARIELRDGKFSVMDALKSSIIFDPIRLNKIKTVFNTGKREYQISSDGLQLCFTGTEDFESRLRPTLLPENGGDMPLQNVPLSTNNRPKYVAPDHASTQPKAPMRASNNNHLQAGFMKGSVSVNVSRSSMTGNTRPQKVDKEALQREQSKLWFKQSRPSDVENAPPDSSPVPSTSVASGTAAHNDFSRNSAKKLDISGGGEEGMTAVGSGRKATDIKNFFPNTSAPTGASRTSGGVADHRVSNGSSGKKGSHEVISLTEDIEEFDDTGDADTDFNGRSSSGVRREDAARSRERERGDSANSKNSATRGAANVFSSGGSGGSGSSCSSTKKLSPNALPKFATTEPQTLANRLQTSGALNALRSPPVLKDQPKISALPGTSVNKSNAFKPHPIPSSTSSSSSSRYFSTSKADQDRRPPAGKIDLGGDRPNPRSSYSNSNVNRGSNARDDDEHISDGFYSSNHLAGYGANRTRDNSPAGAGSSSKFNSSVGNYLSSEPGHRKTLASYNEYFGESSSSSKGKFGSAMNTNARWSFSPRVTPKDDLIDVTNDEGLGAADSSSSSGGGVGAVSLWRRGRFEGMRNLGNTCYIASIMQALLSLKSFRDDILSTFWSTLMRIEPSMASATAVGGRAVTRGFGMKMSCFKELVFLARQYVKPQHGVLDLRSLKAAVDSNCQNFLGNGQQDAEEFLTSLLDILHDDMGSRVTFWYNHQKKRDKKNMNMMDTQNESLGESEGKDKAKKKREEEHQEEDEGEAEWDEGGAGGQEERREMKGGGRSLSGQKRLRDSSDDDVEVVADSRMNAHSTDAQSKNAAPAPPQRSGEDLGTDSLRSDSGNDGGSFFGDSWQSTPSPSHTSRSPLKSAKAEDGRKLYSGDDAKPIDKCTSGSPTGTETDSVEAEKENDPQELLDTLLPVSRNFESHVNVMFQCMSCGFKREPKQEKYNVFSLEMPADHRPRPATASASASASATDDDWHPTPISQDDTVKPALKLEEVIKAFFAAEERDLVCEKCREPDGKTRVTSQLDTLPNVLIVHLKRFKYNFHLNAYVKDRRAVEFPTTLSLEDVAADDTLQRTVDASQTTALLSKKPEDVLRSLGKPTAADRGENMDVVDENQQRQYLQRQQEEEDCIEVDDAISNDSQKTIILESTLSQVSVGPSQEVEWSCDQCTLDNKMSDIVCAVCGAERVQQPFPWKSDLPPSSSAAAACTASKGFVAENKSSTSSASNSKRTGSSGVDMHPSTEVINRIKKKEDGKAGSNPATTDQEKEKKNAGFTYSLRAVVRHRGDKMLSGHYICDVLPDIQPEAPMSASSGTSNSSSSAGLGDVGKDAQTQRQTQMQASVGGVSPMRSATPTPTPGKPPLVNSSSSSRASTSINKERPANTVPEILEILDDVDDMYEGNSREEKKREGTTTKEIWNSEEKDEEKVKSIIWNRCDDSLVQPITEDEMLGDQATPYIFLYTRNTTC